MTATQNPDSSAAADDLNDAERKLLRAAATGKVIDLRTSDPDLDNPANAADWDDGRNVRADFLADLLTGVQSADTGRLRSVKLQGARITGTLDLEARTLLCPVLLRDCHFDEQVILSEATAPAIRMPGCHLPGLAAAQLRTVGNLALNAGFTATGVVNLVGAQVNGQLDLSGARLLNPRGIALAADSLTVSQDMYCRDGFTANGEVRLRGARIDGQLSLTGASLTNLGGTALVADTLSVGQDLLWTGGFTAAGEEVRSIAVGEVRLVGARITGQLNLAGTRLTNPVGMALAADSLTVGQGMLCRDGFTADGEVRLAGARIDGQLNLTKATLDNPTGRALNLEDADVRTLILLPLQPPNGALDLTNTRVGRVFDAPESWPAVLYLQGFAYDSLESDDFGPGTRLRWLRLHHGGYAPHLYDQLAAAYRRAGDDSAARKVAVAKQWRRRNPYNPLNWLWLVTIGYGQLTWVALIWVAVLAAMGRLVFGGAFFPVHMVAMTPHPPRFQPLVYTLDVLLPIGGLGQKIAWQPTGVLLDFYWVLTIAGWVLSTAVVTALTGILTRDKP